MSLGISIAKPTVNGPRNTALNMRALELNVPLTGSIELTHRCNLACVHCYVNLAPNDREAQQRELTTEQWFNVLDQLAAAGTLWLTITGGEPLLRPDFCDIYRHAHGLGLITSVYTNATMITQRHVDLFAEHPPRLLEVTQYGYTRETYDRVTDAGENFDRFQRGLQRLRDLGVAITLKTMAMRDTKDEVHDMRRFAEREGLKFRFDAVISPRIDGGRGPLAQRLTPAEVAEIEHGHEERRQAAFDACSSGPPRETDGRLYECGAGRMGFLIDPYGKLHLCELSRKPGWDVLRDGFEAGVQTGFKPLLAQNRSDMGGCGTCGAKTSCSNCVGMAELERLSPDLGNPYLCQVTDARNADLLGEIRPAPNGLVRLRLRGQHG
jgi:MoaA/NifB/PqqE/SkfB family radical SAM enzyme